MILQLYRVCMHVLYAHKSRALKILPPPPWWCRLKHTSERKFIMEHLENQMPNTKLILKIMARQPTLTLSWLRFIGRQHCSINRWFHTRTSFPTIIFSQFFLRIETKKLVGSSCNYGYEMRDSKPQMNSFEKGFSLYAHFLRNQKLR